MMQVGCHCTNTSPPPADDVVRSSSAQLSSTEPVPTTNVPPCAQAAAPQTRPSGNSQLRCAFHRLCSPQTLLVRQHGEYRVTRCPAHTASSSLPSSVVASRHDGGQLSCPSSTSNSTRNPGGADWKSNSRSRYVWLVLCKRSHAILAILACGRCPLSRNATAARSWLGKLLT